MNRIVVHMIDRWKKCLVGAREQVGENRAEMAVVLGGSEGGC